MLTVVSTAVTAVVGTCFEVDSCAFSTTQPWDPKVMMTDWQPRFSSSWAARCASSTLLTEKPVSSSACVETGEYIQYKHTRTALFIQVSFSFRYLNTFLCFFFCCLFFGLSRKMNQRLKLKIGQTSTGILGR